MNTTQELYGMMLGEYDTKERALDAIMTDFEKRTGVPVSRMDTRDRFNLTVSLWKNKHRYYRLTLHGVTAHKHTLAYKNTPSLLGVLNPRAYELATVDYHLMYTPNKKWGVLAYGVDYQIID